MKAAIINFTGGRENWGCQATSDEMLRFCRGIIACWPQSEIMLVPCLPKHALDSFIERVHGKRIRRIFAADPPRMRVVAAEGTPDEVEVRVWDAVRDLF